MEVASQGTQSGSEEEPPHLDDGACGGVPKPSVKRCSTHVRLNDPAHFAFDEDEDPPEGELRSLNSWPVLLCSRKGDLDLGGGGGGAAAAAGAGSAEMSVPRRVEEVSLPEALAPLVPSPTPAQDSAAGSPTRASGASTLLYIDRIPADASSKMIVKAVEAGIGPLVPDSLDVIRKHKTRHCHGFALLAGAWSAPCNTPVNLDLGGEESIRVAVSDLAPRQRIPPETPTPRSTLRLRLYAQRKSWLENASRLTWTGVLAIIGTITPEWEKVKMLADDMKKKKPGSWAHPSVLLGAYFVDCGTPETAAKIKNATHDERACIDGVYFLVGAQYTVEDKFLHEKGKQSAAERKFQAAFDKVQAGDGGPDDFAIRKKFKERSPSPSLDGDDTTANESAQTFGHMLGQGGVCVPGLSPGVSPTTTPIQQSLGLGGGQPPPMHQLTPTQSHIQPPQSYMPGQTPPQTSLQPMQTMIYGVQLGQTPPSTSLQPQHHVPALPQAQAHPLLQTLLAGRFEDVMVRNEPFRELFYSALNDQARQRLTACWTHGPDAKNVEFLGRLLNGGFFPAVGQQQQQQQ
eukprot:Rhum_TRINITY_DN14164_c24_g1::Rhum_TRINITY_DN14164_c24_g1_i1::g.69176::m.69176